MLHMSMRHYIIDIKVMAYGASYEYTTADPTNKNMSLFCIDVIATLTNIKVAAILKTQPVTSILYLSYLASLTLKT